MTRAAWMTAMLLALATGRGRAADPVYLDLDAPFADRAADLVSRMTADEKIGQLMNDAPAIERLGVPAYEWWNECLHGVARAGPATVFPQAIGLAATFDRGLMREVATAISDEARAKHHEFQRRGSRKRYQGLTFWSPNINIFRDPRWGRGQETYGEDPYLTARMGVEFVRGLQGDDPKYLKLVATAKHFAVHSGPEADRHHFDARPTERDLHETYLPAFEALVREGGAYSVMGAYNRVNGESGSASPRLLQQILRNDWGFEGYVVSDCGAIDDIYKNHKIVATAEEAASLGVRQGCDLECGGTYKALRGALDQGLVKEADLDVALKRLFTARMRLGMFDPPERVPYARIPYSVNESAEHDRLARRAAQESIVLLKNDGVLPLSKSVKNIAVVGPNADEIMTLLGNYYGTPAKPVTLLAGLRNAVGPETKVVYARGADLVPGRQDPRSVPPIDASALRPVAGASEQGLRGEYFRGRDLAGEPVLTRVDPQVQFRWDRGSPTTALVSRGEVPVERALGDDSFSIRWSGQVVPPVTGRYEFTVTGDDGFRLFVKGRPVVDAWTTSPRARAVSGTVRLTAGQPADIRLEYFEAERDAEIRLGWKLPGAGDPFAEAVAAARASDVVVFAAGLNGDVEGEEMKVSFPGFAGGDRTDLELPATQDKLLRAVHATGKPVVLVLMTGSAMAVRWAQEHVPAIVLAWYPGQQGGGAVADVLFGDANPSGRLPVTFYRDAAQLPPFADYSMAGRTYRYFEGEPLYPFGHGLSYTRFEYGAPRVDRGEAGPEDAITVTTTVRNAGTVAGAEVAQLYVRAVAPQRPQPRQQLRGFERVALAPGETREVTFHLKPARDLAHYDEARKAFAVEPGEYEIQLGASSRDIRQTARIRVGDAQGRDVAAVPAIREAARGVDRLVGTAVRASLLRTDPVYAAAVARHFSSVTAEVEMKWGHIERERGRRVLGPADEIVAFAEAHGQRVKGHALVWHGDSPAWLEALSPDEARAALRAHIRDVVTRYKGRIAAWDVVNEAIAENGGGLRDSVYLRKLGPGYVADAFRWAREADPDVLLVYNDYGGEGLDRKSDDIYGLVRGLVQQGVPIGGVGLQMHVEAAALPPAADVARNLRRLAELGLVVNVSEMDVRIAKLTGDAAAKQDAQRRAFHDLVGACVAEPRCDAVTFWGFTDAHSWIDRFFGADDPLLFDESYRAKPAYAGVMDALGAR